MEAHPEVPYLDLGGEEEATEIVFIGQGILRRQELERALAVCLG
ncbi:GTP-binding protein [Thermus sp. CCB_US3_UF1]|nr:GTP-binding protein [Thermus sp. CCB_US3_UF1]